MVLHSLNVLGDYRAGDRFENPVGQVVNKGLLNKGPSIKDVSPKGEGGGYKKCPKGDFTSRFEETRGGRVPLKSKFWETSFMDGP